MLSSNFLVCMLQTGVSSDGTTLNSRALAGVLARVTTSSPWVTQAKSGAWSPGLSCRPTSVSGLPLNFTALARFSMTKTSFAGETVSTTGTGYGPGAGASNSDPGPRVATRVLAGQLSLI